MNSPLISIIIPVYNVQHFVEKCVVSLMEQTFDQLEYIFVDDCSQDQSMNLIKKVLDRYPERRAWTRIVEHPANRGLAAARNSGLEVATGEYVFHCDSDDWVETCMLEKMYAAIVKTQADMAYSDFFITFEKNERYMSNPEYVSGEDMLIKGFLGGRSKYNVWNKLVKRSIYVDNDILFPEGHNMGEDMTMMMVASCCERVVHVQDALYHYVKLNSGAYSNTISEKNLLDIRYNMDRTATFLIGKYGNAIEHDLDIFKLNIKFPFLITSNVDEYRRWQEWYPETNRYVSDRVFPLRQRLLQVSAMLGFFWVLKLHYWLIIRIVYGVIYK